MLAFAGIDVVWPVYLLAALGAAIGAFDPPARHALVPMLVPREHLPNAINLNTAMVQTASVAGPALGGIMIATGGVGWTYVVNAASFLFVVVALLMMRDVPPTDRRRPRARDDSRSPRRAMACASFSRSPIIRSTMLVDFFATFFASAMALLPIFAQDVLHVGASGYGPAGRGPAVGAMIGSAAMLPLAPAQADRARRCSGLWSAMASRRSSSASRGAFALTFACLAASGAAMPSAWSSAIWSASSRRPTRCAAA